MSSMRFHSLDILSLLSSIATIEEEEISEPFLLSVRCDHTVKTAPPGIDSDVLNQVTISLVPMKMALTLRYLV